MRIASALAYSLRSIREFVFDNDGGTYSFEAGQSDTPVHIIVHGAILGLVPLRCAEWCLTEGALVVVLRHAIEAILAELVLAVEYFYLQLSAQRLHAIRTRFLHLASSNRRCLLRCICTGLRNGGCRRLLAHQKIEAIGRGRGVYSRHIGFHT